MKNYFDSIDDLIDCIEGGLSEWSYSHGPDGWDWQSIYQGIYHVSRVCNERAIQNQVENYPDFFCDYCAEIYPQTDLDYNKCSRCGRFCRKLTVEDMRDMYDWMDDYDHDILYSDYEGIIAEAWQNWVEEEFDVIPLLLDEVNAAVEELETARITNNKAELLAALVMGLHCCHVGGNIAHDYCGLPWSYIDKLQEDGLDSVFDQEIIDEFLEYNSN